MSDEAPPAVNGAASDTDVEISTTEDHGSDEAAVNQKLIAKISLLEQDLVNGKVKIKHLEDEISGHESDKRALSSIAGRASELETQVSRLQHDLISSVSDAQEANAEVSNLKRKVVEFESKDIENEAKLNVIENERNLLLEKLKESEERFRETETEKARKIEVLMSKISEFEAKERENAEKLKESDSKKLRKIAVLMNKITAFEVKESEYEEKICLLVEKLTESENKISQLESEAKIKDDDKNGIVSKVDWPVVAVSAGAVVTLGLVCFRHAKF